MTSLWSGSYALTRKTSHMLDIIYVLTAFLFFAACWALTKACEKL